MRQLFERYRSRLYPFLAVADQALQSLVNLLSNIFIIRFAAKEEYGVYGVGFASLLLVMGVANALFMLQMTVTAPDKPEGERPVYFGSMLVSMYTFSVLLIVMAALGLLLFGQHITADYRTLIWVVVGAAPGILTLEFMRQYHYFYSLAHRVLIADLVFFLTYFGAISAFVYFGFEDIHLVALAMNGLLAFVVGMAAIIYTVKIPISHAVSGAVASFREAWKNGAWAVGGVFISQMQSQGYVYLLALLKGPTAVAEMNAARLFLSPLLVMSNGFSRVIIPKMAMLKSEGKVDQAVRVALKVLALMLGLLVVYMAVIAVAWPWISEFLAERGYENLWIPVALWGIYYIGNSLANTPRELLKVYRKFRLLTLAGASTAVVVFAGSIPAIIYFGIVGAIVVLAIGDLVLALILWVKFNQIKKAG